MPNYEENVNKGSNRETKENRQNDFNQNIPESLNNPIYTPGFLREQIGKLIKVEFLIGTNNIIDKIGVLEDVGASYILIRSFEGDNLTFADINSIKFITISANPYFSINNMPNYNNQYSNRYY